MSACFLWRYFMDKYYQNLLEQLRLAVIRKPEKTLTDEGMVKAMTVNAELQQLGYSLNPQGITELARSESADSFYRQFVKLIPEVSAKPMYPDFPRQVMEISEAEFRFHQICHYMSTYGVRYLADLFGVDEPHIGKGWLPEVTDTEKTEKDDKLLDDKIIEIIYEEQMFSLPLEKLLGKPEKLTRQEVEIINEALNHVDITQLNYDIPFKKNMMPVFHALFSLEDRKAALQAMRKLCVHTGDVLKCIDYCLTRCDYHFKTGQKKQLVQLIESYPVEDWKANVILTDKKARRTILVLQYLSYNRFSESPEHKEVVRRLRNGELSSWQSQVVSMLSKKDEKVIDFIAARPGMLLRWTNWLIKLGYEKESVLKRLLEKADDLSSRTLAISASLLGRMDEREDAYDVLLTVLKRKMSRLETPFRNKKVFINEGRLDLDHSILLSKGDEAGYIRNGLAYRIPENVRFIRLFIYWNDSYDGIDIDLHATGIKKDGEVIEIGWDNEFNECGIVHSGDITTSDAAEYIDIDLSSDVNEVQLNVNLFSGDSLFSNIQTCFIGMMAVNKTGTDVKLYNPENCFFVNDIRSMTRTLHYGYVNIPGRYLCLDGTPTRLQWMDGVYTVTEHRVSKLTVRKYLEILLECQGAVLVSDRADCDVELVMEKPEKDNQVSVIDSDFFL